VSQSNRSTRYLSVTLYTQLTWSAHIHQVRKKAAQRLGVLGSLLNRRIGLSITNRVLLYKQLIRPMMDYMCPVWRFAAHTHVGRLQVLQSKGLHLATGAPWYIVTGRSTRIWEFHSSPTTSEP
jgi:hypothetical protein